MAVWLGALKQDIRLALRMLHRTPSVSVPAVLVLALGIGTATALYAIVYTMWLRPLPYPDAGRLVSVTTYFAGYKLDVLVSADYGTWQDTSSLGPLGAYSANKSAMIAPDETLEVGRARVSGQLLDILRIYPRFGRNIQPADDKPQAPRVAMVSEGLWRDRFGADAGVIGRPIRLDGDDHTIIGVLPHGFRLPDETRIDVVTALALDESRLRHGMGGGMSLLRGVARLHGGMTLAQARAELSTRLAGSRAQAPKLYGDDVSLRVIPLRESVVQDIRAVALILLGAVASILLISSTNVAGLLTARAAGRGREMAVRVALGASTSQIARLLLVEGLAIGLAGAAGGLVLARGLLALVLRLRPSTLPGMDLAALNNEVLATALAVMLVCALGFSLAPALPLPRLRVRRALVVVELGLSLILLTTAASLLKNLAVLRAVSPGFQTEQVVTASISLKGTRFAQAPGELQRELRERLARVPGTVSVAFADALPPSDSSRVTAFSRADRPLAAAFERRDNVIVRLVEGPFFKTMGIRLQQGRVFTEADQNGSGLVAVVNRTLADRYFAGESALGKQVDGLGLQWKTVVGIVADTHNDGLRNATRPEIYLPLTARNTQGGGVTRDNGRNLVIRTAGDPAAMISVLRGILHDIDRALLARTQTMNQQWADLRAGPRFQAAVFSGFAVLALVMASTGIYGVLSHVVVLRRREIGIRIALGARPADVQGLVLREALTLALGGVVMGLAGAIASGQLLATLLYQVDARDPFRLAATAALILILAIGASAIPARRASRQDPAQTLRAE